MGNMDLGAFQSKYSRSWTHVGLARRGGRNGVGERESCPPCAMNSLLLSLP